MFGTCLTTKNHSSIEKHFLNGRDTVNIGE